MASFTIGEPLSLARLARGAGDNARSRFSQVHGFRDGTKRRRQELCATVDGHSVNIYEIQNGRNLCSHTVPPNLTFECPPYSIRKKTDTGTAIRKTYSAVQRRGERQILLHQYNGEGSEAVPIVSCTVTEQESPVIQIDYLPSTDLVFVLHASGGFELLAADTLHKKTQGSLDTNGQASAVLSVLCLTRNEAAKSILKARPDVIASLHPSAVCLAGVVRVAAQPSQKADSVMYGIWALSPVAGNNEHVRSVMYHNLSATGALSGKERDTATFAFKNTRLVYSSTHRTLMFDLTSLLPRLVSDSPTQLTNQISSINISEHLMLCSNLGSMQLYNSTFRSVQATLDFNAAQHKRKRDPHSSGPIQFICYFPQLRRVIATRKRQLVAVDLYLTDATEPAAAFRQSSSLIGNIGKGRSRPYSSAEVGHYPTGEHFGSIIRPSEASENWIATRKSLDQCVSKQDAEGYEQIFAAYVATPQVAKTSTSASATEEIVDHAIASIFQPVVPSEESTDNVINSLELSLSAYSIINWLSLRGLLTPHRVQSVVMRNLQGNAWKIGPAAICKALMSADKPLSTLRTHLKVAPYIDVSELCHTVKFLVRRALEQASLNSSKTVEMSEPDHNERDTVDKQMETPSNTSQDIAQGLATCLVAALEKLAENDQTLVVPALRSVLDQRDMITVVQFLRQQLFHGGYTRALQAQGYPSPPPSETGDTSLHGVAQEHQQLSLDSIAVILSSSIDALGPLGIISMGDNDQFLRTLVTDLSLEVSRALASLEDAAYLQGLLRETLRFSESAQKSDLDKSDAEGNNTHSHESGSIQILYAESGADSVEGLSSVLPLSLRSGHKIDSRKVRKGDGSVSYRSQREMGMLQDRLRAPYSLERLVL